MEEWKPLDIDGYEVSSHGRVRSVRRKAKHSRSSFGYVVRGKILKARQEKRAPGRLIINIRDNENEGKKHTLYIHRIVANCFVDNPSHKDFVVHIDGNVLNNKASNLLWVSKSEMMTQSWKEALKGKKKPKST